MRCTNMNIVANLALEIRQAMVRVRAAYATIARALHLARTETLTAHAGLPRGGSATRSFDLMGLGVDRLSWWAGAVGVGNKPVMQPVPCPKVCLEASRR